MTVQQEVNFHAGLATFGKTLRKFISERAALEKILREGDGRFGVLNFPEHRWKKGIAVVQKFDFIAADDGRVGESFQGGEERRLAEFQLGHLVNSAHFGATDEQEQN